MKITAIIPARYGSTRFEGKALADICGKPMIQHVHDRTVRSSLVSDVIVATDDERIAAAVRRFGGIAELTSPCHETGTDRLAEVAARIDSDIIVNVQGDEPLIEPDMIDEAIGPMAADSSIVMATLKSRITTLDDFLNPNVVKVVTDRDGFALYFSRSPLPHFRDEWHRLSDGEFASGALPCYRHVGLYVYRRDFLLRFAGMPPSALERAEKLEQLRVIENGFRIKVVETVHNSIGVDTPADLAAVIRLLNNP